MRHRGSILPLLALVALGTVSAIPPVSASSSPAALMPGAASDVDSDGDGIPDAIENQPWYQARGGSPDRKDVWVECDTMRRVDPARAFVRRHAAAVFDQAPVANPSGQDGIALHVTFHRRLRFQELIGDGSFEGLYEAVMQLRRDNFAGRPFRGEQAEIMRPYMRYCVYVNAINTQGTSGIAFDSTDPAGGIPGDTLVVSIGGIYGALGKRSPETQRWETGTFIHELGHVLGLTHGGAAPNRHTTFKPNYLSVMNYHFQQGFVAVDGDGRLTRLSHWDYSRFRTSRVDERSLSERRGVRAPAAQATGEGGTRFVGLYRACSPTWVVWFDWNEPVDFDCNGRLDANPVTVDLNRDGALQNLGRTQNDWDNLVLEGGTLARAGARREPVLPEEELTLDEAADLERQIREARPSWPIRR